MSQEPPWPSPPSSRTLHRRKNFYVIIFRCVFLASVASVRVPVRVHTHTPTPTHQPTHLRSGDGVTRRRLLMGTGGTAATSAPSTGTIQKGSSHKLKCLLRSCSRARARIHTSITCALTPSYLVHSRTLARARAHTYTHTHPSSHMDSHKPHARTCALRDLQLESDCCQCKFCITHPRVCFASRFLSSWHTNHTQARVRPTRLLVLTHTRARAHPLVDLLTHILPRSVALPRQGDATCRDETVRITHSQSGCTQRTFSFGAESVCIVGCTECSRASHAQTRGACVRACAYM